MIGLMMLAISRLGDWLRDRPDPTLGSLLLHFCMLLRERSS